MSTYAQKKCTPCESTQAPLAGESVGYHMQELAGDWKVVNEHHIEKDFKFKDFNEALAFVNKVGQVAEIEQHHPDIHLAWGHVKIVLWTHNINGLSENDFIVAAKIDQIK